MHTREVDRKCPRCGMEIMTYIPHECDPTKMKGWNPTGGPEYVQTSREDSSCKCKLCKKVP